LYRIAVVFISHISLYYQDEEFLSLFHPAMLVAGRIVFAGEK
jgi:hypothetical protein